jgi:hypothetical protein
MALKPLNETSVSLSSLFLDINGSDCMFKVENQQIIGNSKIFLIFVFNLSKLLAHRSLLQSKSEYFRNSFDEKSVYDTVSVYNYSFKVFKHVLKIVYECDIEDEEWDQLKTSEMFEALKLAEEYCFNECKAVLLKNLRMPSIDMKPENDWSVFDLLENSLNTESPQLREVLTNLCLIYIDENAYKLVKNFDKYLNVSASLLIKVFQRDSFGVAEIEIFGMIRQWIHKNKKKRKRREFQSEKKSLLALVRLNLMTKVELTSIIKTSHLFSESLITRALENLKVGKKVDKNRKRSFKEANIKTSVNKFVTEVVSVGPQQFPKQFIKGRPETTKYATKISIELKKPTPINNISFDLMPNEVNGMSADAVIHYYIEVMSKSKWHKVIDKSKTICFSTEAQDSDFEQRLVSNIQIFGINLCGKFQIKQLSYELKNRSNFFRH